MKISVVIPCRNEERYIEECIHAIYNSDLQAGIELNVFVVDGMSSDGTRSLVSNLSSTYPTLHLLDNMKQLTPYAFNIGIYAKEFDYVQIVGSRHILSSNYIQNCINTLSQDSSIWCAGGRIINEYVNEAGKVIAQAMSTKLGMGIGNFRTLHVSGFTDTVTSPMYPNWVFDRIGYFDEDLVRNQDDDFNYRVTKAGGKIYFDADISLKYYVRGNYLNLWKQFNQYGYWKVFVNRKHKAVTTLRQLVPPLFVFYLILAFASWMLGGVFGGVSNFPLLCYVALVTYTSWKIKKENEELNFVDVWKTFPILHISYGLGYLKGIWHFMVLKRRPSEMSKELSR